MSSIRGEFHALRVLREVLLTGEAIGCGELILLTIGEEMDRLDGWNDIGEDWTDL